MADKQMFKALMMVELHGSEDEEKLKDGELQEVG